MIGVQELNWMEGWVCLSCILRVISYTPIHLKIILAIGWLVLLLNLIWWLSCCLSSSFVVICYCFYLFSVVGFCFCAFSCPPKLVVLLWSIHWVRLLLLGYANTMTSGLLFFWFWHDTILLLSLGFLLMILVFFVLLVLVFIL